MIIGNAFLISGSGASGMGPGPHGEKSKRGAAGSTNFGNKFSGSEVVSFRRLNVG